MIDCSGNENFCTATITVEDKRFPYIECPGDIEIECDVDNDGYPLPFDPALALPAHAANYPLANVPSDLAALQAWAAAGYGIGNPSPGQDAANGITGLPLASDNCGATVSYVDYHFLVDDVLYADTLDYGTDLPINDPHECAHHNYNIRRVWTVTDQYGQSMSCTQNIQVRDEEAPVINANGIVNLTDVECSDQAAIDALLALTPTADDNCYLASFDLLFDNSGAPETFDPVITSGNLCVISRIRRSPVRLNYPGSTRSSLDNSCHPQLASRPTRHRWPPDHCTRHRSH